MRTVGLKVLKNKLAEYVRIAAAGEIVLVTDRDRIVAELIPPREGRSPAVSDAVLLEDVRRGLITPRSLPRGTVPPRSPMVKTEDLLRALADDRADR